MNYCDTLDTVIYWQMVYTCTEEFCSGNNNNDNNNNNNNELYSVHIHTYIQVADVGMIESGHMAAY